jgi:ADP-ribose pyrophosphatase YjhB (NUDIX family)
MSAWLDPADWKRAQETMPIPCVDVVPVRLDASGKIEKIGLIFRDTPHQGERWCIVGGRLWRNETLAGAITRQLRETLGPGIGFALDADPQPDYVSQYFPTAREVGGIDPRQHAVTVVYVIPLTGEPVPGGEATDFRWFDPTQLPGPEEFGFGQAQFMIAALRRSKFAGCL